MINTLIRRIFCYSESSNLKIKSKYNIQIQIINFISVRNKYDSDVVIIIAQAVMFSYPEFDISELALPGRRPAEFLETSQIL